MRPALVFEVGPSETKEDIAEGMRNVSWRVEIAVHNHPKILKKLTLFNKIFKRHACSKGTYLELALLLMM
jgi:hypothetical protein